MNEDELIKKAQELEQTLQLQIAQLKKESGVWLKVGGAMLLVGLVAYKMRGKSRRKKKEEKSRAYEKEEADRWTGKRKRERSRKTSSFFPPFNNRLLMLLFSLGQSKVMAELNKSRSRTNES